jgi:hypothetical protein
MLTVQQGPAPSVEDRTVRFCEKRYLWNYHLYYVLGTSCVDDASHDADERCLELNRGLLSDYFKSHLEDPDAPLKPQAHTIRISPEEAANALKWAEYVTFIRTHSL